MKKLLLLICGAFFSATMSFAQARIDIGIKGGLNFASLNTSTSIAQDYSNRTGYHLGAYVMFKLTKIAIQPEIVFSKQGQTYSIPSLNVSNGTNNFDYINIPIMIKFYLIEGLNLQAGPQFGFLASSSGNVYNTLNGSYTSQSLNSFVKSSDVTLALGVGWDLPFGLNITGRYNLGLSDINKLTGSSAPPNQVSSLGTSEAKNQVIQISAGFRLFKLGK
jgi:hypothetical protein